MTAAQITQCPGCGTESSENYDDRGLCWLCYADQPQNGAAPADWLAGSLMNPTATPAEPLPTLDGFPFLHSGTASLIVEPTGGGRSSLVQSCLYAASRSLRGAYHGLSKRAIREAVSGKGDDGRLGAEVLISEGYVVFPARSTRGATGTEQAYGAASAYVRMSGYDNDGSGGGISPSQIALPGLAVAPCSMNRSKSARLIRARRGRAPPVGS